MAPPPKPIAPARGAPPAPTRSAPAGAAAAPSKTSARGASPQERGIDRGITRGTASPQIDPDRGVDLGGVWDAHGNYWYADDSARQYLWRGAKQQWEVLGRPEDAIHLSGRSPQTQAEDRAAQARNDAFRQFQKAPGRQYARDYGVVGVPPLLVGKLASEAATKVEQVIPPELDIALAPSLGLLIRAGYLLNEVEAEIADEKDRRDMEADAKTAYAHGELFQLPVVVSSTDKPDDSAPPDPMVIAGTTNKLTGKPARAPARVEGFLKDLTTLYRKEIAVARKENPGETASWVGTEAERRTLARVEPLARARGLNPEHIWVGNFPVSVSGPRGGVISAEMGSPHYGFILELKKSPKAVRGFQAQAYLLAVDHSLNFPERGLYLRVYGENYKGAGVDRVGMGAELDREKAAKSKEGVKITGEHAPSVHIH